jgi:Flp pilus assembly pilin Flp
MSATKTPPPAIAPPRGEAGIAALELGLMAPFLALMVVAAGEVGFTMIRGMQAQNAAEAGAVYASRNGLDLSGISSAVLNATSVPGLTATPAPTQFCGCPSTSGITEVSCTATCSDDSAPGMYSRISAQITREPLLSISGLLVPQTVTGQAVVRIY